MTITMSKEERISLRASAETKQLLQRAAELSGVSISEYVLSPARERAQHDILDQRFFFLSANDYDRFITDSSNVEKNQEKIQNILAFKAPWEN